MAVAAALVLFITLLARGSHNQPAQRPLGRPESSYYTVAGGVVVANFTALDLLLLKPTAHIMPLEDSWLNDPNGMMEYKGLVHVWVVSGKAQGGEWGWAQGGQSHFPCR